MHKRDTISNSVKDNENLKLYPEGICDYRYTVVYVHSGKGQFAIEGRDVPFSQDEFFIFKPLTFYSIKSENPKDIKMRFICFMESDLSAEICKLLNSLFIDDTKTSVYVLIRNAPKRILKATLSTSLFAEELPAVHRRHYIRGSLSQFLAILTSADASFIPFIKNPTLPINLIDYICNSFNNGIIVEKEEILNRTFINQLYVLDEFQSSFGISMKNYINYKKIMLAKKYMEEGHTAISASKMLGYADYSSFYRAYVKIVGKTPTAKEK